MLNGICLKKINCVNLLLVGQINLSYTFIIQFLRSIIHMSTSASDQLIVRLKFLIQDDRAKRNRDCGHIGQAMSVQGNSDINMQKIVEV